MSKCKDNVIITIGRSFGSGGREIGRKLADELEIPFYDKELLEVEAKEGAFNLEALAKYDEKRTSGFLYAMAFNPYEEDGLPFDMMLNEIQMRAIEMIAGQGSCVIVGRRADKILRHQYDILNVFISASMEKRIARVSKRDGLSEKDSQKKIHKADRSRRAFYNSYGDGDWGEAANYNLCIDSGDLGTEHSVDIILQYLRLKGKLL